MRAKLSILGLYNYDNSILDGITQLYCNRRPNDSAYADEENTIYIEAEDIRNAILLECSAFSVIYPDMAAMKLAIDNWWNRKRRIFTALLQTTMYEYDPISNYDRKEIITDTETRNLQNSANIVNAQSDSYAAGYDAAEPKLVGRDTNSGSTTGTDTGTITHEHTARVSGNIGVTTTQQMIESQREVVKMDVISEIVDSFKTNLCVLIY